MNTPRTNPRSPHARVALTLAVAAALAACSDEKKQAGATVNLYEVSREDLPINVKEGGELVAVNETVVRSEIEGQATILWLIPEGTRVKKGEKLVEMDVSELVEKRASQEIAVEKARNALEQAKTAKDILEKELQANLNTAESQRRIAIMELEKLLGAKDGKGSEGKNADMVQRLRELTSPRPEPEQTPSPDEGEGEGEQVPEAAPQLVQQVHPQNYAGLVDKVTRLLRVDGDDSDPLQRDMGEMANLILQQADTIRLAMADLKVKEDTAAHSRRLAAKQFITRNELERDELAFQSQASKVTIAWNDLELLVNYTLERNKIELNQNVENAELEVARVVAKNDAERRNSQFDVDAKQKEFEVAAERLTNLEKQIGNAVLYSPGDGLVVYSKVSRGRGDSEPVEEGTSVRERQSIIILPDNSKLECKIQVQEAQIDKVKVGMPAHVSAEVRPNEVMMGRVVYVAPVADSQNRWGGNDKKVYTTRVLLDGINDDETLKAGMKAAATITVDTVRDVLTVPIQSVRRDRAVHYVWKRTETGPKAVPVEIGANNQEKVEIRSGVSQGEMIYRTPPGGQADPKFDQPDLPEPARLDPGSGDSLPTATGGPSANRGEGEGEEGGEGGRSGRGNRRGGMFALFGKKLAEMTPEELAEIRNGLKDTSGIERMRRFAPERADAMEASYSKIGAAIDSGDLPAAQQEIDAMRAAMRPRGGGGGERGERGGRGDGERGGRGGGGGERGGRGGRGGE